MFEPLKNFLADLTGRADPKPSLAVDGVRMAAAALLVHVADSDGELSDKERDRARTLVAERFHMEPDEALQLVRQAVEADREEVGVDRFVNILNRSLDNNAKLKIVAMMWEVVYSDGGVNDAEDSIVWRIASMMRISSDECETLRRSSMPDSALKDLDDQ